MQRVLSFGTLITLASLVACTRFAAEDAADASSDAAGGTDGSVTDAATVDASAPAACGWSPFDDDFERSPELLKMGWTASAAESTTSTIAIDENLAFKGSSKSLRADVQDGGSAGGVYLRHSLTQERVDPSCVAVAFALRVHEFPQTEGVLALTIQFGTDTMIGVSVDAPNTLTVAEQKFEGGTNPYKTVLARTLKPDTWVRVELRYEQAPSRKVIFTVNGDTQQATPQFLHGKPTQVRAGVVYGKTFRTRYFIDALSIR